MLNIPETIRERLICTLLTQTVAFLMRKIHKLSKSRKPIPVKLARSLMSRLGALRHCDSKEFFAKSIKSLVKIKKIKEIIRNESRKYDFAQQAV